MAVVHCALVDLSEDKARLAGMFKALGNPNRLRMLEELAARKVCITSDMVLFTSLAQSTVSQHLKVLREAGLIEGEIDGPATCYCLNLEGIKWLKAQVGNWLPGCCDQVEGINTHLASEEK